MRDPKRINNVMTTFKRVWKRDPDIRLGQLISNFQSWLSATKGIHDIFHIEDDRIELFLIEFEKEFFGKE